MLKKGKSFDFKKTKTLNNFNKNQIQLRYFVIFQQLNKNTCNRFMIHLPVDYYSIEVFKNFIGKLTLNTLI